MTYPNVIMIGHRTKQGKDTFADYLMRHTNMPVERLQVSDLLKDTLAHMFDLSREQLEEIKDLGDPMRGYHQKLADSMRATFGDTVFIDHLKERIKDEDTLYIIDDLRDPVEILDGCVTVKVVRPLADAKLFNTNHRSEIALDSYDFDHVIVNDGSLFDLEMKAQDLLFDLGLD